MNNVNKTLYIPLYGKAAVSQKGLILHDPMAEEIWAKEGFALKGKAKSKWLTYNMAMRSAVFDDWTRQQLREQPAAVVLHIGCGMDSRVQRVAAQDVQWYDIDFPDVIQERRKYFEETAFYHLLPADMREETWKESIQPGQEAIVILEGVSMYFRPQELEALLSGLSQHFRSVKLLMDCYSQWAAKASKYKNPINDVGVTLVYGYDEPRQLAEKTGFVFVQEHELCPQRYIDELPGLEKALFKPLFAGKLAKNIYRLYEFKKA